MKLTRDQVLHIAKLARLKLSENELQTYTEQLASILTYVDILNELDTENISPTYQVTGLKNVMNPDIILPCARRDQLLSCSSLLKENHQIKVHAVFD